MNEKDQHFIETTLKHFFVWFLENEDDKGAKIGDTDPSCLARIALIKLIGRDKVIDWFESQGLINSRGLTEKFNNDGLAQKMFDYQLLQAGLEDRMLDFIDDFTDIWWDWYDSSLELDGVPADERLNKEGQEFVKSCGFSQMWITHVDGMETYYPLSGDLPNPGSRKKSHRFKEEKGGDAT